MSSSIYPLGHSTDEIGRLEHQAKMLVDPLLGELAMNAESCLELGVGIGSNLSILREGNPALRMFGVDNSVSAIQSARASHGDSGAEFSVMSATDLSFPEKAFDLVFSKLLLWSIGSRWRDAVSEAFRVLRPGGMFYAFEPFDKGVLFEPPRPALQSLIQWWDEAAVTSGLDPFIGPKVPRALHEAGFIEVRTKSFPVLALAHEEERYFAICDNLRKFYFGDSPDNPIAVLSPAKRTEALDELFSTEPGGLVMDQFFVTWGPQALVTES